MNTEANRLLVEFNMNKFKFGWTIEILHTDEYGFQIELADLGNKKYMIVATDTKYKISDNSYRQAGFGPFLLEDGMCLDEQIKVLKNDLLSRREDK